MTVSNSEILPDLRLPRLAPQAATVVVRLIYRRWLLRVRRRASCRKVGGVGQFVIGHALVPLHAKGSVAGTRL